MRYPALSLLPLTCRVYEVAYYSGDRHGPCGSLRARQLKRFQDTGTCKWSLGRLADALEGLRKGSSFHTIYQLHHCSYCYRTQLPNTRTSNVFTDSRPSMTRVSFVVKGNVFALPGGHRGFCRDRSLTDSMRRICSMEHFYISDAHSQISDAMQYKLHSKKTRRVAAVAAY
jgi:hypothetical protein